MVVATVAMHMPVRNLFCTCITDADNHYLIVKSAPCKRMVKVDIGVEFAHLSDHYIPHASISFYCCHHTGFQLGDALLKLQVLNRYTLYRV